MTSSQNQVCTHCVMDTTDPAITFNSEGLCNHCRDYHKVAAIGITSIDKGENFLKEKTKQIKADGKFKEYDSILGLSGGVDSTYVAYLAKEYGLNPIVVHLDNGWNSELAADNIKNTIRKLGFDLFTYVINWEEFKDLQLSYLKASVIDIEAITDHAILATLHKLAAKYKVKYILSGSNIVTEAILPNAWITNKMDAENIKDIHNRFGQLPLKTFPFIDKWDKLYYFKFLGIETVSVLDHVRFVKSEAKDIIAKKLKWRDYGGKHHESIFTRFYQGYILPVKFNVDKRKAHLSTLICSGQISREEAIKELELPIYDENQLKLDKEFVLKKLDLNESEFQTILSAPVVPHSTFKTEKSIFQHYPIFKLFRPLFKWVKNK